MQLLLFESLRAFRNAIEAYLVRHEAEHGVMLGVMAAAGKLPAGGYAAVVVVRARVVGAALRLDTRLLLSNGEPGAVEVLANGEDIGAVGQVSGPPAVVQEFLTICGRTPTFEVSQGVYENRAVRVPDQPARGARRLATPDDLRLLTDWRVTLHMDVEGETPSRSGAEASVAASIGAGLLHVWEDAGEIVSSAAAVAPTPHGIRVSGVYTPPRFRGRGYASILVAQLTQSLLASGRTLVFLHTDLANATSNAMYQRVGYERVADFVMARI